MSLRWRTTCAAIALVGGWLMALATGPAAAQSATYVLAPERSFVHWEVLHFNTSTTRGRFGPVQGQVEWDRSSGRGDVGLRVNMAGLDTGIGVFNARLRQADLLATEAHPEAFFTAQGFRLQPDGAAAAPLRGELTLKGISAPLALRVLRFSCRSEAGTEVCGGDLEAEINRSEFGMSFGLPFIADRVRLLIQVEAERR